MAKKETTEEKPDKVDRDYVIACAKKQLQLDDEAAKKHVSGIKADVLAEIETEGRAGNVARVRELLGC